jgi:hypothetical protein
MPEAKRHSFVVNPSLAEDELKSRAKQWLQPGPSDSTTLQVEIWSAPQNLIHVL